MAKRYFYNISICFLFFTLVLTIHPGAYAAFPVPERIPYSDFKKLIQEDKLEEVILDSTMIKGILKAEEWQKVRKSVTTVKVDDPDLIKELVAHNVKFSATAPANGGWRQSLFLLWFIPMIIFLIMMTRLRRGATGAGLMSIGKSRANLYIDKDTGVTFDDVAGVDEAKEELKEVIDFLSSPERFQKLGGKIPKGVLLIGPPGTGKTLLARAVAGEAGVPFFSISGSDFVEMFVGMGAARVRDMFEQAKEKAPCIVFIDEIDSVGRQRGTGLGGGHDEREQTLNQLLAEMDGFNSQKGVIIVAATNRPDVLDSALLRPGRFDRQITVDRPDLIGREAVLAVHAKSIKLATEVSLKVIAKRTPGFSGADLANVINEAALLAARHDKNFVGIDELESSIDRVIAGPERKSRIMSDVEKKTVAFHESGHTLVAALLPNTDPVHKVSIIPRGTAALGYTMQLPMEDKYLTSESEILDTLCVLLGGRAAEELVLHEISTGAQNDLEKASHLARNYVCRFGMSRKLGPQTFGRQSGNIFLGHDLVQEKEYSDKTAIIIDEEVTHIIMGSYEKTKKLLNNNKDKLELLAKKLEEEEVLEGEQVLTLLNIEKKRPRTHKEVDIAPVEQPQQNLQFINKETDKK